ncbi:hypothetical protein ACQPZX_26955 [Actinoplanes sp. CA-142083]|uniref:hypothetical protein n=1 Tax=Actinoplanes sp. CA-142083 TaxID=3239903 RepID=UPI003D8A7A12
MSDDFLRDALREERDSHTPDRTAMLNRVAANRAGAANGPAAARGRLLRLAGSALGVLLVLGLGGVAKWVLAGDRDPAPPPPLAAASPSEVATATSAPARPATTGPRVTAGATTPSTPGGPQGGSKAGTSAVTPSASPVRGHPGDTQAEKGSLWSDGSIPAPGRSEVTLKPGADLTELDLTIRVTLTSANPSSAGFVAPDETITATVTKEPGALLYHFVMREGATLKSGTYVFAAKYSAGRRDAADDTYESYVTSVEHKRIHVYGNFASH